MRGFDEIRTILSRYTNLVIGLTFKRLSGLVRMISKIILAQKRGLPIKLYTALSTLFGLAN